MQRSYPAALRVLESCRVLVKSPEVVLIQKLSESTFSVVAFCVPFGLVPLVADVLLFFSCFSFLYEYLQGTFFSGCMSISSNIFITFFLDISSNVLSWKWN